MTGRFNFTLYFIVILLFACETNNSYQKANEYTKKESVQSVKYATGFTIDFYADYKVVTIKNAWKGSTATFKYVLYTKQKPINIRNAIFIKTPIKSIACMSLTHLAFLEKLGLENTIVAVSGCKFVSNKKILKRISDGFIQEIGHDAAINYELLIDKHPAILMTYGIDQSTNQQLNKFKELGIKTILNSEYMETSPLGKLEWIKLVGALFNKDDEADKIFTKIETDYLSLKELTKKIKTKPTVFTGMPWNGSWYVPGGESFQAQLFKDAGVNYLWHNNKEKSSFVVSKEVVIDKALEVDFWLNLDSYNTINQVVSFDEKFNKFKAIRQRNLYNNNKRLNKNNGNDYWESGVVNPHIILKDLIKIFHPQLLNHQLYYYKKLD